MDSQPFKVLCFGNYILDEAYFIGAALLSPFITDNNLLCALLWFRIWKAFTEFMCFSGCRGCEWVPSLCIFKWKNLVAVVFLQLTSIFEFRRHIAHRIWQWCVFVDFYRSPSIPFPIYDIAFIQIDSIKCVHIREIDPNKRINARQENEKKIIKLNELVCMPRLILK